MILLFLNGHGRLQKKELAKRFIISNSEKKEDSESPLIFNTITVVDFLKYEDQNPAVF